MKSDETPATESHACADCYDAYAPGLTDCGLCPTCEQAWQDDEYPHAEEERS